MKQNYKKLKRYNIPNHIHEITFSCWKRQKLLNIINAKEILAESIIKAKEKHLFNIYAYVFMPSHVHILIKPMNEKYSIAEISKSIKQSSSRSIIYYIKLNCPEFLHVLETGQSSPAYRFWMPGGGYDRNIIQIDTLKKSIDYIHNNPVKAGLVGNALDWKWSSCKFWMCGEGGPLPVDRDGVGW